MTRLVYLDESGTGRLADEPSLVVVGVIVHADKQWLGLERYLRGMADEYVPPEHRQGFAFHATELYSGGKIFSRQRMSKEARWKILDELCETPAKFDLPIVCGCYDRRNLLDASKSSQTAKTSYAQMLAGVACTIGVERYMRERAEPSEVAVMIYESNDHARAAVRFVHACMQITDCRELIGKKIAEFVPLMRIVDAAHFAEKKTSSLLQIADCCAFAIRRKIQDLRDSERFFAPLDGNLLMKATVMETRRQPTPAVPLSF